MSLKKNLELFYYVTEEIKPDNEDEENNLENRKVVINVVISF